MTQPYVDALGVHVSTCSVTRDRSEEAAASEDYMDHGVKKKLVRWEVRWQDAFSTDAWTDIPNLEKEPHRCVSTGYLVGETPEMLLLAGTVSQDGQACCVIHIPRRWIRSIRRLPS